MKLLLIAPGWPKGRLWGELGFKFPSLALAAIAAATPEQWTVALCDENVENLDPAAPADLVAITAMTPQAPRAYEIAALFRNQGTAVVMGGFHASNLPEEALQHVNAVVVGEGEPVWPRLLADVERGTLQPIYRGSSFCSMEEVATPCRDIFAGKGYLLTNTIQTTRGCPYRCEFCSVSAFYGTTYRERPVDQVLAELAGLRAANSFAFFVDDNLVANRRYALELFAGMRGMGFKWLSHAPIDLGGDRELLKSAGEAGCIGMFVGFESLRQETLRAIGKVTNRAADYVVQAQAFRDHGIGILGSFVLGCDGDGPGIFDDIRRFCNDLRIEGAIFPILTPYPGTPLRKRLEKEGRIISHDWRDYDMGHVTFMPRGMTPQELQAGHEALNASFYSFGSMYRRLCKLHRSVQIFGPMNFGFRTAIRRTRRVAA